MHSKNKIYSIFAQDFHFVLVCALMTVLLRTKAPTENGEFVHQSREISNLWSPLVHAQIIISTRFYFIDMCGIF